MIQTNYAFLYIDQHDCISILCLKKKTEKKNVHIVFKFEQKTKPDKQWGQWGPLKRPTHNLIKTLWLWLIINYGWWRGLALSGSMLMLAWLVLWRSSCVTCTGWLLFCLRSSRWPASLAFCCLWTWAFLAHQQIPRRRSGSAFCVFIWSHHEVRAVYMWPSLCGTHGCARYSRKTNS